MAVTILTAIVIIGSVFLIVAIVGLVAWNRMFKELSSINVDPD